jgi:hypothetical protein
MNKRAMESALRRLALPVCLAVVFAAGDAAADPLISRPFEPQFDCVRGLDSIGSAVATGGDFDGDGIVDFAYGAPCAYTGGKYGVGRIWIRSGKNGKVLRRFHGYQTDEYFGAALAFVGDLDGDGKDELAVGSPFFDASNGLSDAGQVTILGRAQQAPLMRMTGDFAGAEFGASIDGIPDLTHDQVPDLIVGAPGRPKSDLDTRRTGAVMLVSGADGIGFQVLTGEKVAQRFGTTVRNVGLADGDDVPDFLVTSEKNPVGLIENAGAAEVFSGADPTSLVFPRIGGAKNDRLGASSASLGEDGLFMLGSPGTRVVDGALAYKHAGLALALRKDGSRRFTVPAESPQENAQFGTAVAMLHDVNGDGLPDYAVSEPFADLLTGGTGGTVGSNVGRVTVLSGSNGAALFQVAGTYPEAWTGRSLAAGVDLNKDGFDDLISGNPGDSPFGRRGAGTVRVFSGANGNLIRAFKGARGFQTRIYTATSDGSAATVRGFAYNGKRRGVNATVFDGLSLGALSIDVMDRTAIPAVPGQTRVVVGTGHGSTSSQVTVLSASQAGQVLADFEAFPGQEVGVNVAAGDLDNDGTDEIVAAQADSATGDVLIAVYERQLEDPLGFSGWNSRQTFQAFAADDVVGMLRIKADGANIFVTGLRPDAGREIIAAPYFGQPVVRVFSQTGKLLLQFLAYDDDTVFDGVSVAAVDLDGDGVKEILTAPMSGPALIRAFTDDGLPFTMPGGTAPVSFLAFPEKVTSGLRVSSADVDLDGRQEILVVSRHAGEDNVLAFEADGTPVEGYKPIDPVKNSSAAVASATDRFVRK